MYFLGHYAHTPAISAKRVVYRGDRCSAFAFHRRSTPETAGRTMPRPKRPLMQSIVAISFADFAGSRLGNICTGAVFASIRSFSMTPAFQ